MNRLGALMLWGCGDGPPDDTHLDQTITFDFAWSSGCALTEDSTTTGECATVDAPAYYDTYDETPFLQFTVYRLRQSLNEDAPAAMWLLGGDLGSSGESLTKLAIDLAPSWPGVDFYIPDLRGSGKSSALTCGLLQASNSEGGAEITASEWEACQVAVTTGFSAELPYFTTLNMAYDVEAAIRSAAPASGDQDVTVYATGYGAIVANQILATFPDKADHPKFVVDRIVFDGPLTPDRDLAEVDTDADGVVSGFFRACELDNGCSGRLGSNARDNLAAALTGLADGACPDLVGGRYDGDGVAAADDLRAAMYALFAHHDTVSLVPAVAYRLERCDAGDVAALGFLLDAVENENLARLTSARPDSPVLALHVGLGELWNAATTVTAARATLDATVAAPGLGPTFAGQAGLWPAPEGAANPELAAWTGPVLILAGDLDARQTLARSQELVDVYSGADQQYVPMANATQRTLDGSPVAGGGVPCGEALVAAFVAGGMGAVDVGCTAQVTSPGFEPSIDLGLAAFGAADPWDAPGATAEPTVPLFK